MERIILANGKEFEVMSCRSSGYDGDQRLYIDIPNKTMQDVVPSFLIRENLEQIDHYEDNEKVGTYIGDTELYEAIHRITGEIHIALGRPLE